MTPSIDELAVEIIRRSDGCERYLVAIAGPPGAGKSTLSDALIASLDRTVPGAAVLVPMDGFHLDNGILEARGLLDRKGAPETFDVGGLQSVLERIRSGKEIVYVPVFDRGLDVAKAGARTVGAAHTIILVDGNYLLLKDPPWPDLAQFFDLTLAIEVDAAELRRRLVNRWLLHGLSADQAAARADANDIINARRVRERSKKPDIVCRP